MTGVRRIPGVAPRGTAVFDMALGILLVLTGTDPLTVKAQLMTAARRGRVDVFHLAAALVALACGQPSTADTTAVDVALENWGPQLSQLHTPTENPHPTTGAPEA